MSPMHPAAASSVFNLKQGTLLNGGRYRIVKEINRGGTAVVYAAEDLAQPSPGGMVALKVMHPSPEQLPLSIVKREIAFSSSIRHDCIVRLLDVFAENAMLVIVWELILGPDLLDLLNEHGGRLSEPLACFFFVQLLEAVDFMHSNGFCHRDIKPENAMIQRSTFRVKLIDFGLSKHLMSAHTLGVGTPDYLCPEMLPKHGHMSGSARQGDQPAYDAKAVDAWAMGVLLFLLTTGKYPFEDPAHPHSLAHTIGNVIAGRVRTPPETMSQDCRRVIAGLLKLDPKSRTTLHELKADAWMVEQARSHAARIGKQELLDFRRYSMHLQRPAAVAASPASAPLPHVPSAPEVGARDGVPAGQSASSFTDRVRNYFKKRIG